jgi:hypothetical protein
MILASLKPYYYYLIGERKKTIEVRKSALKNLPQDIVFYMSKDEKSFAKIPKEFQEKYRKHFGKIGMKVVCDKVERFSVGSLRSDDIEKLACLSYNEMICYFYKPEELDGETTKQGFAWHISDLKIYDKPKELGEFYTIPESGSDCCFGCIWNATPLDEMPCRTCKRERKYLYRPPQSYMFVEEVEEQNNNDN